MKPLKYTAFLNYKSICVLFLLTLVSVSCSVQKRRYMNGLHVDWHRNKIVHPTHETHAQVQHTTSEKIELDTTEIDALQRDENSFLLSHQHLPQTEKKAKITMEKVTRIPPPLSLQWPTHHLHPSTPKEAKAGVIRPKTLWWFALSALLSFVGMITTVQTIYAGLFTTLLVLSGAVFALGWIFLLFNREARWQSLFATVGWLMVANAFGVLLIYPGLYFAPYLIMGFAIVIAAGKPYGKEEKNAT